MPEPFDDLAKSFYRHWFEEWGLSVETERQIFSRSRTIDLVVRCTEADRECLQNTVFAHFRRLNALELKGAGDPLTLLNLNLIMMRAWGLGAVEPKSEAGAKPPGKPRKRAKSPAEREANQLPGQRTVTIVCVNRPERILDDLREELRIYPTEEPGIYCCPEQLPQWIIYPTELELVPRNYPLLALAKGEKLAQFMEVCLAEGQWGYLELILDVGLNTDPDVIWPKILKVMEMKPELREETWKAIDEFFRQMPEAEGKLTSWQEALDAREQRGALRNQQKNLIHLLQHKFPRVPVSLIQRIEEMEDMERLTAWLDLALDANTLAEVKQGLKA